MSAGDRTLTVTSYGLNVRTRRREAWAATCKAGYVAERTDEDGTPWAISFGGKLIGYAGSLTKAQAFVLAHKA